MSAKDNFLSLRVGTILAGALDFVRIQITCLKTDPPVGNTWNAKVEHMGVDHLGFHIAMAK